MFRRVSRVPLHLLAIGTRSMAVFTEQSAALQSNASALGYPNNVWIEDSDLKYIGLTLKDGQTPTTIQAPKQMELFNLDQLDGVASDLPPVTQHTSFSTRKQYSTNMVYELESRACVNGWKSKYWIHPATAKKNSMIAKRNQKPSLLLLRAELKVYHSTQFTDPDAAQYLPTSGGTRRQYRGDLGEQLRNHAKTNRFKTALYYTGNQAQALGLDKPATAQALNIDSTVRDTQDPFLLFNAEQIVDYQNLLTSLGRTEPVDHCFLMSGDRIINEDSLPSLTAAGFISKLWVTGAEAKKHNLTMKAGIEPVRVPRAPSRFDVWNAEQFANPEQAFKMAGMLVR